MNPVREPSTVDLNADLGEGFGIWKLGDDDGLLEIVTSANVACGFHGGDPQIMRRVCGAAAERGVSIGAQVAYRDLAGFGRRRIDIPAADLVNDILYQIGALDAFARVAGTRVSYLKPHGALYLAAVADPETASAIVEAVRLYDSSLPLLAFPGSELERQAEEAELMAITEAIADRAYTSEGTLVSRRQPGAVLVDPDVVSKRAVRMARDGSVEDVEGGIVHVQPRSICLHGDTPGAVSIARQVRSALLDAGVRLSAFS